MVQKEVDDYVDQFNDHHVRFQPEKVGPSGCSMNYAFENPAEFNGTNNYVPIDPLIIDDLMEGHDGAEACKFFPDWVGEVAGRCTKR